MLLKNTRKVLNEFGAFVVKNAKISLSKGKKNASGALSKSLKYQTRLSKGDLIMTIKMIGYGAFVDQGVQGANPSGQPMGAKHRVNQAPKSPYKFGSGKGGTGLRAGINKRVTQKNLKGVRDKQGRFIPRKSLQFLIVRSIWNTGLKPTLFLTNAFNKRLKKTEDKIIEAFFKDYAKDLEKRLSQVNTK